jgi:hypothetical protein
VTKSPFLAEQGSKSENPVFGALRREGVDDRVGALIMGWPVGELLQSIEGVK